MVYENQSLILNHRFVSEARILQLFQAFRTYKYNVKANRDTMREMIMLTEVALPNGQRFFENGRYIDVDGAVMGETWQVMISSLDQPDRAIEAGKATLSNDARVAFEKSIHTIKLAFLQPGTCPYKDIYDRASFEAFHGLVWVPPPV